MIGRAKGDDPSMAYGALLADKQVSRTVFRALRFHGWARQDLEDGLGEVRLRVIAFFARGAAPPTTVPTMRALCRRTAVNYAIDCCRRRATEEKEDVDAGLCEDPDEYAPFEPSGERRDPVDAARQLEVAAELFREGVMPDGGVAILEGVASGCCYREVADDLGISSHSVQGRLKTMRRQFRARIAERRMG